MPFALKSQRTSWEQIKGYRLNLHDFKSKWARCKLTERAASQQHFLDLCEVLDHPKPAEADPTGESFTFERGASKVGGGDGWADVWKRGFFGWEYKGRHKDLDVAYQQLLQYREALENPPLLVVCDMDRIIVHTNFTGTVKRVHEIPLEKIDQARNIEILRAVFSNPEALRPDRTSEVLTAEVAATFAELAQSLRSRGHDSQEVAHFLDRLVFCLFAEDIELLPRNLFTQLLDKAEDDPERFARLLSQLFDAMAAGGDFGLDEIRRFNGNLFADAAVLDLTTDEIHLVHAAARYDWSDIDPSIFGTLFERGLDPDKRSQLGAHYTSRADIETIVEPVVMQPLRAEWDEKRAVVESLLATGRKKPAKSPPKPLTPARRRKARRESASILRRFLERLAQVTILDPACGSGNFLYIALQQLKDLEKEIILYSSEKLADAHLPMVGPWQLYGIEINPYAFELAQMTVWIGHLQWTRANGFHITSDPVLRPLDNFHNIDAILDLSDPDNPREPEWPRADFIIGNPPFLGGFKVRSELSDEYADSLLLLYGGKVAPNADICCYWFEKARRQIEEGKCRRAGLLATQGIRGGVNRKVLERIKGTGDIFFAESDRPWILDGANVHVSMVGFDNGGERLKVLDGVTVQTINTNLTSQTDVTSGRPLPANDDICRRATEKGGPFEMAFDEGLALLLAPNPHGRCTSDVVRLWANAATTIGERKEMWIVDFFERSSQQAALYEAPFEYLRRNVKPKRQDNRDQRLREQWWLFRRSGVEMRKAVAGQSRFLCTAATAKHRILVWIDEVVLPDHQLIVFARSDDYFFGVLHSRLHEVWAYAQGTQLREKESGFRYTPTTCFQTFPLPEPTHEQEALIAGAAHELDALRSRWLSPPEWTREEILEFPASADGPWYQYVADADAHGIGTARYPRIVPKDAECAKKLKSRTLTNLYNERPTWLDIAHRKLDEAVFAAYGWPADLSDEDILKRLLDLNLQRAQAETDSSS